MVFSGLRFPSTNKTDRHDITEIVFSTNKTDSHDITEILLNVELNIIPNQTIYFSTGSCSLQLVRISHHHGSCNIELVTKVSVN